MVGEFATAAAAVANLLTVGNGFLHRVSEDGIQTALEFASLTSSKELAIRDLASVDVVDDHVDGTSVATRIRRQAELHAIEAHLRAADLVALCATERSHDAVCTFHRRSRCFLLGLAFSIASSGLLDASSDSSQLLFAETTIGLELITQAVGELETLVRIQPVDFSLVRSAEGFLLGPQVHFCGLRSLLGTFVTTDALTRHLTRAAAAAAGVALDVHVPVGANAATQTDRALHRFDALRRC